MRAVEFSSSWNMFLINKVLLKLNYCVRWSFYKYKCLWSVGGKDQDSRLQEGVSHTYTLRLGQTRILFCIKKKKNYCITLDKIITH